MEIKNSLKDIFGKAKYGTKLMKGTCTIPFESTYINTFFINKNVIQNYTSNLSCIQNKSIYDISGLGYRILNEN